MNQRDQEQMYGCTQDIIDAAIRVSEDPAMLAQSILSDAQEAMALGHRQLPNQLMNRAKYVIETLRKPRSV